ncbi:preprotein translocase subunit YajC [Veillonella sp. CHU110]|uniref:preprotein translocase subunit YajC n=1 Tax=Veillonella sp. CHU110 TaxID=2490947 RepID=UPI000F8E7988|nr:preprotein translocase subunit YajC [Veillonella sp. CHU110]
MDFLGFFQGQTGQAVLPVLIMVVIFYFMLYRPQKKQQKKRQVLLDSLKKGQKVLTIGGIHGEIVTLSEDTAVLRVAEKVEMTFARSAIAQVLGKDQK